MVKEDLDRLAAERDFYKADSEKSRENACLLMGEVVRLRRAMEFDGDQIKALTKRAEKAEHELAKLRTWVKIKGISLVENYE